MKLLFALFFLSSCCLAAPLLPLNADTLPSISIFKEVKVERKQLDRNAAVLITDVSEYTGHGSGIYVKYRGQYLVVTAAHVLRDKSVRLVHGPEYTVIGEVVYEDADADIAVLLVPKLQDREPVKLTFSVPAPEVGDSLHYSGFPREVNLLSFEGELAGYYDNHFIIHSFGWMGLSGAGVLDDVGNLVGIAVSVRIDTGLVYDDEGNFVGGTMSIVEDILNVSDIHQIRERKLQHGINKALKSNEWDKY